MRAAFEGITAQSNCSFTYRKFNLRAFPFRWHFHPEFELTWIVSGQGRRFVGDHIGDFAAGDLALLGQNLPHTWHSQGSATAGRERARAVCIQFRQDFVGAGFFAQPELARVRRLLKRSARGLAFGRPARQAVSGRLVEMERLDPLARLLELLAVLDILARSSDVRELSTPAFVPALRLTDQRRIDRVYRFINQNFTGRVRLADAAALAHLSPSAFSRFFRRLSGKGFSAYVNELRIGSACRLLIETDRSIASIAFEAGFSSLANFNRRFLEQKRVRPKEFRAEFYQAPNEALA
jgi:AraC-like DNA-binding protein